MPSRPVILITALFAATLVAAVVGYAVYWSYASTLRDFQREPTLPELLSRVSLLKYNATLQGGESIIVTLQNDPVNGNATLTVASANGSPVEVYTFKYNKSGIVEAKRLDPATGNATSIAPSEMESILLTPTEVNTTMGGWVTLKPAPGLAPLVLPFTVAKELHVDWATGSSPYASVRVGFIDYTWNGRSLRGLAVTVEPTVPVATTAWSSVTSISMIMARVDGVPAVVQASIVAGTDRLDISLLDLKPAQG